MDRKRKKLILEFIFLLVICTLNKQMLVGFIWVILHEAVHILVANNFGLRLSSFKIHITGAGTEIDDIDDLSENRKLILYVSGPLFNFVSAMVLIFLKSEYGLNVESSIWINLGLLLFNMLPAYPLDGVRIYEILLSKKILYKKAKKLLVRASFMVAAFIMIGFLLTIYIHKVNISLLLASVLLTYTTFLENEKTIYIIMGSIVRKSRRLISDGYIENKSISVYYKRDLIKVLSLVDRNKFNSFFVLDDDMRLLGIIYEDELIKTLKESGNMTLEELLVSKKNKKD
ncbi:site-2 protease family protein [Clostridium sp.]|uniref:site-2 protease family protein n=1 Tax=Clostridium sp. TaxID=1506 RepID=UPI002903C7F7|nr:site-2 protease family protein [Clostridium sp.]MDU2106105.1 peptidase M50 [Clostridium sp.]MDU3352880.1 peptidase M50 [Clostridium sp.]